MQRRVMHCDKKSDWSAKYALNFFFVRLMLSLGYAALHCITNKRWCIVLSFINEQTIIHNLLIQTKIKKKR